MIVYGNYGEDNANDITIADQLPAGVTFVGQEAPVGVSFQGAAGAKPTWKISSLAYGEGGSIKVTVRLSKSVNSGASLAHDLTIASNPADLVPAIGQTEQPDREQTALTVGPRKLFVPLVMR